MGFKAHDEFDCEYSVTESDAKRLALLLDHPVPPGVVLYANVTFFHEGLTSETRDNNLERARDDSSEAADQLTILGD